MVEERRGCVNISHHVALNHKPRATGREDASDLARKTQSIRCIGPVRGVISRRSLRGRTAVQYERDGVYLSPTMIKANRQPGERTVWSRHQRNTV